MNKYISLYSNCISVDGYNRSIIYDLQRSNFYFIPNNISYILKKKSKLKIDDILELFSKDNNQQEIEDYINLLIEKDFLFLLDKDELDFFPLMDLSWWKPSVITNLIIDFSSVNQYMYEYIEPLGIFQIAIRVNKNMFLHLDSFLTKISNSRVKGIQLILDHSTELVDKLDELIDTHLRINEVIIYNSPTQSEVFYRDKVLLVYKKEPTNLSSQKKNKLSNPDLNLFTESQKHHTYFNRKLYIGLNGEIKNAPECEEEFGYIQGLRNVEELKSIISNPEFQKYWLINKELCDVCKDCEFRHMCVDNFIPYQRADKSWYHKEECNYNPYISKWKGEEGYQSLGDIGILSNENGFSINHKKITEINNVLWQEESKDA